MRTQSNGHQLKQNHGFIIQFTLRRLSLSWVNTNYFGVVSLNVYILISKALSHEFDTVVAVHSK